MPVKKGSIPTIKCELCLGTGFITCQKCNGKGKTLWPGEMKTMQCSECKGEKKIPCPDCNDIGYVYS